MTMIKLVKDSEVCYFTTDKISALFEPDQFSPLKNATHVIMIIGCPPQQLTEHAYREILNAWISEQPFVKDGSSVKTVDTTTRIVREPFLRKS